MNDPRRLIDDGATDFESKLLQAGRRDAPSRRGRRRILAGLGLGGIFSTIAISTGAEASARGWLLAAGGSAAGALAVFAGVQAWSAHPSSEAHEQRAVATKPAPLLAKAPAPLVAPPVEASEPAPAPTAVSRAVRSPAPAERRSDGLTGELASLDEARRALARNEPGAALRALDDYSRSFPERRLGSEATVLRVEALSAAGDRARARRVGEDFLRTHPKSPYEKRIRSLIESVP